MAKTSILIVDDAELIQDILRHLFKREYAEEDYEIVTANSLDFAEKIISAKLIEIAVISYDSHFSEKPQGGEFIQKVRKLWPQVITVLMYNYHVPPNDLADIAIQKPFNLGALRAALIHIAQLRNRKN